MTINGPWWNDYEREWWSSPPNLRDEFPRWRVLKKNAVSTGTHLVVRLLLN